ncbi:hypothetical protein ABVT39_017114 [Epinephelus coioides]
MAQQRVMLMCYNSVEIRTSGPWTLSRHLGLPEEPASNIPPASHQAAAAGAQRRKRGSAEALGGGAVQRVVGPAAPCSGLAGGADTPLLLLHTRHVAAGASLTHCDRRHVNMIVLFV